MHGKESRSLWLKGLNLVMDSEYFIYEILSLENLDKPILLAVFTKGEIFGQEKYMKDGKFSLPKFVEVRYDEIQTGNLQIMVFGKYNFIIYYAKQLPEDYYAVSDMLLVNG